MGDNGDKRAKYYVDDIVITEQGNLGNTTPTAQNLNQSGSLIEQQSIGFTYDYNCKLNQNGSVLRVLRSTDETALYWVTVKTWSGDSNTVSYTLSEDDIGKKIKFEVLPMNENGEAGIVKSIITNVVKSAFTAKPAFTTTFDNTSVSVGAKVSLENNLDSKNVIVMLSLFDENNLMCAQTEQYKNIMQGEASDVTLSIPVVAGAKKARLFVWDGTSSVNTSMISYVDFIELQKNN